MRFEKVFESIPCARYGAYLQSSTDSQHVLPDFLPNMSLDLTAKKAATGEFRVNLKLLIPRTPGEDNRPPHKKILSSSVKLPRDENKTKVRR